tara:strand:- start:138 stop:572 length:435 start_codon:yes stop_codon:yes gene_type:complete
MYFLYDVDIKFVNQVIEIINAYKGKYVQEQTCTEKGIQTSNIINLFNDELIKEIITIKNIQSGIFWLHYIKYNKGGYQREHNHPNEKYSFILYLNDADGDTIFKEPMNIKVSPKKGRIIIFDAKILHYAMPSFKEKKVLVGAIK